MFTMLDHSCLSAHLISHSSSSSGSINHDNSDIDLTDGCFRSFWRAVCSLPAITTSISSTGHRHLDLLTKDTPQIYLGTYQIIKDEGVTYSSIGLDDWLSKFDPEWRPIPTLVIIARRVSSVDVLTDWREVTRKVYRYLASHFPGISVELIDEEEIFPWVAPRCLNRIRPSPSGNQLLRIFWGISISPTGFLCSVGDRVNPETRMITWWQSSSRSRPLPKTDLR